MCVCVYKYYNMTCNVNFKTQPAHIYPNTESSPPDIELSQVNHPNIKYDYNQKHTKCNMYVPTIEHLLITNPYARKFGVFNEIEYSANMKFKNIARFSKCDGVMEKMRYYFKDTIKLFHNDDYISTTYIDGSREFYCDLVTRVDYFIKSNSPDVITSKLKVVKNKFNYCDVTYSLTGSIEIDFPELKNALSKMSPPTTYTRCRRVIYWNLLLTIDDKDYTFRIAFRQSNFNNNYECNIECEDLISGSDFINCFDLLSKYYKRMYIVQNGYISPLILDPRYEILLLSSKQQTILKSLRLISHSTPTSGGNICDEIKTFLKSLSWMYTEQFFSDISVNSNLTTHSFMVKNPEINFIDEDSDELNNDDMF